MPLSRFWCGQVQFTDLSEAALCGFGEKELARVGRTENYLHPRRAMPGGDAAALHVEGSEEREEYAESLAAR